MVATRRGAKKAPEAAPAPSNTLNAPPKRGGRKKAVVEEAAAPAPAITKPTKTTTAKRKAVSEPEDVELPVAKKPAANTKATRTAKVETKAKPAPAAPKRATRSRKVEEPAAVEEPVVVQEVPKPAATRGRKAPAKKTPAPKVEEPTAIEEAVAAEAPKAATRARKAPAKRAPATRKVDLPVIDETVAAEPVKPAPRGRKAAAPAPAIAGRATRGRNVAAPPQDSPLKAPARKPTKKAAAVAEAKAEPEPAEEPFAQFPGYPTTPAHIAAPLTAKQAMSELPQYPNTPAHILAPISNKDALSVMPGYPKTPSHIVAPMITKAALAEMASYPKTPAHIKAPVSAQVAMAEMPGYPKTPAHIAVQGAVNEENVMDQLPDYPNTPAHITALINNQEALNELPDYPKTPAHIQAPLSSRKALAELPDYPKTPAHIIHAAPVSSGLEEQSMTPAPVTPPHNHEVVDNVAIGASTPYQNSPPVVEVTHEFSEASEGPANITWGVTDQEAFEELPAAYPTTPAHIAAPVTTKEALAELPEYPKTPAHITAPITPRRALAELPDYPTTPAIAIEAAIQEEITASVKKETISPLQFPSLENVSFHFAATSGHSDSVLMDIDSNALGTELTPNMHLTPLQLTSGYSDSVTMDIDSNALGTELASNMHLAPLQLTATFQVPELASPMKSALRSPQKMDAKTPKKAVTWDDPEESDLFLYDGLLQGMTFYVDVTSNGREQNYLFSSLLEDLGAKVVSDFAVKGISHVLYKDGNNSTLKKVLASKGAIKCVNVGWVLDCEEKRMRMDETPYLVDLSTAIPSSPIPTTTMKPFTPARTPSKYALPPSQCNSAPTTPTSSEFDRSFNHDDKENCELGIFFDAPDDMKPAPRTLPHKKSTFLFSRSPIKTPSKPSFLSNTPVKPMSAMPFSTSKKRSAESVFTSTSIGPPKKLRLF
ncbi:hypothetical protein N0V83_002762 [Neocucurbitaria cava]|uniref:BRCT domain-containing protein n=1 Tax=Neocucurbitaria cava TaxID=798079 RepID=A0A9W8YDA6_9PLEO|nr:hypothetical protein N0V83_002762 [Neocucurbitaria cava]